MNLTKLDTIKARLGLATADTQDDAILKPALAAISERIANDCNRVFAYAASATFTFHANEMDLCVDRYPVATVASFAVKDNETDGWQAVRGDDIPDFNIGPANNIIELSVPLGTSRQMGQVTFAGGYLLPGCTGAGVPLPADLEQAGVEQVCYWYQRRTQLGLVSVSGDGGSISQFRTLDLLPGVLATVKRYTRMIL